ncbi:MAG TPA: DUF362 domain-containing protein [Phycisphaerae bacterium]|nr:DUF362 domain-containing protein [Phycisphaerae bacterium]
MAQDRHHAPDDITRRDFLIRGGATLAAVGAGAAAAALLYDPTGKAGLMHPQPLKLPNYFERIDYPLSDPRISVARGPDNKVAAMVKAAVDGLGGVGRFIAPGDVVLLKPNVGFERVPELGATTNPDVLRALIRLCKEAGASNVVVADNPIEAPESCFSRTGILEASRREGATILTPAEVHFQPIAVRPPQPDGRPHQPDAAKNEALGTWPIFWKPLAEADKVIGVAPIKDHNLSGIGHASMTMKNWYGLLGGRRNQFHQAIANIVSDLGFMMSPTLTIADGTRVLMRNGPTGGSLSDVKPGHTIAAAVDSIALDAWCYRNLLDRDPANLRFLDIAYEKFGGRPFEESHRFAERDWQAYRDQGKIVETNVT